MSIVVPFATGAAFGLALEKAKVYLPDIIINQMLFKNWTMATMFFTAAAGGTIIFAGLESAGIKQRSCRQPVSIGVKALGPYGANIVGGTILGIGMTLSGSCPGTVFVQLGAGLPSAWYVLAGGVGAAFSYGYIAKYLQSHLPTYGVKSSAKSLDSVLKQHPTITSSIVALSLTGAIYALTSLTSYRHDIFSAYKGLIPASALTSTSSGPLYATAWSPVTSGALVALLQLPSLLLSNTSIGLSSSYIELAALLIPRIDLKWRDRTPYLSAFTSTTTLKFAAGVVAGAFISATLGGVLRINQTVMTTSPIKSVVGGALLVLGARVAGGCTSGHGISGMAQLGLASFVTVAAMFAGGIATALLLA
ncbi:hypothetical protein HDV00_008807 [Rhizophlyctis rosea]|nr:hypothetical protein HDV00_008807 [Rhizophlyctis rosea]